MELNHDIYELCLAVVAVASCLPLNFFTLL